MSVTRVGFILKPDNSESLELLSELVPWLRKLGHVPVVADEDQVAIDGVVIVPRSRMGREIDIAAVLGGDGTILGAAALVADASIPVLGINLGRLGFLTPFDPAYAESAIEAAITGKLETRERMRLDICYQHGKDEPIVRTGLNDAVIHQASMARLIEVEVRLDDKLVSNYRADGLIIATPTGSTAYNLAAGGPIIETGLRAMALTPISPHSLTSRPLVVPGDATVTIALEEDLRGVVLTVDGQWAHSFMPGDRLSIAAAEKPLLLFESDKHYFDILREKLHWGARTIRAPGDRQPALSARKQALDRAFRNSDTDLNR